MKRSTPILVAGCAVVASVLFGSAARAEGDQQLPIEVSIDGAALQGRPECVGSAWAGYGLARANGIADLYVPGKPFSPAAADTFTIEVAARDALAKIWSELKGADPKCSRDPYLDVLLSIQEAGLLREYVWQYLRSQAWQTPPGDLKAEAFQKWARDHLKGHTVETLATVKVGRVGDK